MTRNLTQVAGSFIGTMEEFDVSDKKPLVSPIIHITDSQTGKILDTIPLGDFWDDNHHKSLKDTLEFFEFRTFGDKRYSQHLEKMNRIIIPDEDGTFREFVITHATKYRSGGALFVYVYAPASYLLLKKSKVIKPQRLEGRTAKTLLDFALSGTEWQSGEVVFRGSRTFHIEQHTNPYSLIHRNATEFGLEPRFRIETDGNKVIGRYVDLLERVGEWQGREVEFGRDLLGIERKVDDSNVVTALIGLGPERDDGTRLEVFVEDEEALQRWGIPNPQTGELMHLIETYEPESTDQDMTLERLTELTRNELEKRINSVVEYTADVSDLEKVPGMENKKIRFGDTIKIKDVGFNPPLYLEARVHTQDRSLSQPEKKKVTLGDYIEYTEEEVHAIWKQLQAEIAKKVSMAEVTEVVYTKPEVDQKDIEVKDYAEGVAENKKQEAIQISAEDATNKANQAENRAKNHADTIAEQKKQEAINASIADADAKLSAAKTELEADIALKADAEWVNGQLVLKENAITKSNTAPANPTVGQLWLDTSVTPNVLKRWSGSEWVKATPTSAGEVGAYTKTEVDNALNSKVSVTQYTTDMNGVVTRLNSAESRITQNENEIATKVSNTTYQQDKAALENDISALETRMANAETSIMQNANQIALKANKTDVYTKTQIDGQFSTINQQISQLDAELSVQADQIATKVSRTEFESLQEDIDAQIADIEGTLTSHSTKIEQNAQQIQLRATKTEVDALSGRVSTVESTIQQHADMIESKIDDGQARSIFRQEASSFTFEASQINFKGHVFGEDATFMGSIGTPMLTVGAEKIDGYENFGLRLQTAQWQPDPNNPFVKTGYIVFNTLNNALEIYRIDENGDYYLLDGILLEAARVRVSGIFQIHGDTYTAGRMYFENNQAIYHHDTSRNYRRTILRGTDDWVHINPDGYGRTKVGSNLEVAGSLNVSGAKNAIHKTKFGMVATPAYEMAESYLGDIGTATTGENGECIILIDEVFKETVNTEIEYHVFLSPYSQGIVWVEERKPDYFVVKSDRPNVKFVWEVKAKRRGYEDDRLEKYDNYHEENEIENDFT